MLGLGHHDDDDDDNHLCIKCNATIIGLDNYIHHRKNLCPKLKLNLDKQNETKNVVIAPMECDKGADAFFQSLQLQSSVKKSSLPGVQSIPSTSKSSGGVLTRRAIAAILAKDIDSTTDSITNDIVYNKLGEDWIGGHSLKVTGCDDNQTKLIKAVANISESSKKEQATTSFNLLEDEDSNDDAYELEDIDDEDNQSGGKWKSISGSLRVVTPEPLYEWEEDHTGGKWKHFINPTVVLSRSDKVNEIVEEEDDDVYMPPPGYTKGKWIPGAKQGINKDEHKAQIMDAMALHNKGSVQYWCGPCNRRLGSKSIYERHLTSKLHLKRTLPEKDLEYSGTIKNETSKRVTKPSAYLDKQYYEIPKKIQRRRVSDSNIKKFRRKRLPTFIICLVCRYKVRPHLLGKHLISHYHFRKGDLNDEFNKTQILNNIHKIIHQSPFQCGPCKFYANWQAEFMRHWRTKEHRKTVEKFVGKYWCSFCKFECNDFDGINSHLLGDDHQEVIAAINRSIPIIIRKRTIITCATCNKEFKYNIQLKRHEKLNCKIATTSTASDEYQGRKKCHLCPFSCKTKMGIYRHIKRQHLKKMYYCSACCIQFKSAIEVKEHRRNQRHRIKEMELRKKKGFDVKDLTKACPHCDAPKFKNVINLKEHIQEKHKNAFSSCSFCGMKFIFPQEVTWHLRNKACDFKASSSDSTFDQMWKCRVCPFLTASHAECIYHEVLHGDPIGTGDSRSEKYTCPVCNIPFPKHSLRCHIRMHTNEKPHACKLCSAQFVRRSNLLFHIKRFHSEEPLKLPPAKKEKKEQNDKEFLCSECGSGFSRKFLLKQHMTMHAGRIFACSVDGCLHKARNASELRLHAATHSDSRPFKCPHCSYRSKTKLQLNRHCKTHSTQKKDIKCPLCPYRASQQSRLQQHLRHHNGDKPFACRFCPFTCNSLENLRKHVLYRTVHKNKFLYECVYCPDEDQYKTNFAKDFRVHLTVTHTGMYPNHKSTAEYVSNYLKYVSSDDAQSDQNPDDNISVGNENEDDYISSDKNPKSYSTILDEFSTDGCYSVTESGTLVPYLQE